MGRLGVVNTGRKVVLMGPTSPMAPYVSLCKAVHPGFDPFAEGEEIEGFPQRQQRRPSSLTASVEI